MKETIYVTCFADVILADSFVAEAEARWPGEVEYEEWNDDTEEVEIRTRPAWDSKVASAMHEAVLNNDLTFAQRLSDIGL